VCSSYSSFSSSSVSFNILRFNLFCLLLFSSPLFSFPSSCFVFLSRLGIMRNKKTHMVSIAIIPPLESQGPIQKIREEHDKQVAEAPLSTCVARPSSLFHFQLIKTLDFQVDAGKLERKRLRSKDRLFAVHRASNLVFVFVCCGCSNCSTSTWCTRATRFPRFQTW